MEHLCPETWLDQITPADAEGFITAQLDEVAVATANKHLRTIKAIFNWAIRRDYLRDNPFARLTPEREPQKVMRVLTHEEVMALLEACPSARWRTLIFLALTTGMRLGELRNLEWEDVDLKRGWLVVRNKTSWRTKSAKVRRLPLVSAARRMLQQLGKRAGFVFQTQDGQQMRNNVQRDFQAIVANAMIGDEPIARCGLANAGQTAQLIQEMCGHASYETTAAAYVSIYDETKQAAADGLPWAAITTLSPLERPKYRKEKTA